MMFWQRFTPIVIAIYSDITNEILHALKQGPADLKTLLRKPVLYFCESYASHTVWVIRIYLYRPYCITLLRSENNNKIAVMMIYWHHKIHCLIHSLNREFWTGVCTIRTEPSGNTKPNSLFPKIYYFCRFRAKNEFHGSIANYTVYFFYRETRRSVILCKI